MLQADDEYMISDYDLLVNRYISVPKTYGSFNPGAVVAGIVRGMLEAAGFPARWADSKAEGEIGKRREARWGVREREREWLCGQVC